MTSVAAYLALVVSLAAVLCGHQAQPFPPLRWWRALRGRRRTGRTVWARGRVRAAAFARSKRRTQARDYREAA